jgi:hypothetical protein
MRDMVEFQSPEAEAQTPHHNETVRWRRFGFDHSGNSYGFETTCAGDRSRVVINGKAALELPCAVWLALLAAVDFQRFDGSSARNLGKLQAAPDVAACVP